MRIFPILAAIVVCFAIYLVIFYRGGEEDVANAATAAAEAAQKEDAVGVIAVRSVARDIDSAVVVRGQTEADRQVELRAETSGLVISEPRVKGAFITAGDIMCRLDPATREISLAEAEARLLEANSRVPEAAARLKQAEAALSEAKINDTAAQELVKDGFASETRVAATMAAVSAAEASVESARSGLSTTQSGIQSAEAAVAAAKKEIDRLTITAPFDGLLETSTVELGSLLQPGALCGTVIQLDPIILVGFVPETDVARVEIGAQAGARLASGDTVTGNVVFVSRSADPTTRTFRVEIKVPNPDLKIRDGQTAEIIIGAEGAKAHLLPQSALTLDDNGDLGVRLVTAENKAEFAMVTLLRDSAKGVWLDGLPEEADVIIIGQEYVADGVAVAPSYQEVNE